MTEAVWIVDQRQGSDELLGVNGHGRFFYGWRHDDPETRVWV